MDATCLASHSRSIKLGLRCHAGARRVRPSANFRRHAILHAADQATFGLFTVSMRSRILPRYSLISTRSYLSGSLARKLTCWLRIATLRRSNR
jgi:hypothetical protein